MNLLTNTKKLKFCEFDNTYSELPDRFYARLDPTAVAQPELIILNSELAQELGIDTDILSQNDWATVFSGNQIPEGSEPLAMAYAGHQFGHFTPQLGDGRAILIGEIIDVYGARRDLQLKGSGITPFSRQGDGRAALGPVLREYIVSEAMSSLGIPTTRSLAAVTTGEPVYRETALPGAILTRVARSYVRVGTFEYFAVRKDTDAIRTLANYTIKRLYPELEEKKNPYLALLEIVTKNQANLIAKWMGVGFIHGVMNTDNMAISGETIDYGPCAFMDTYDPDTVFSSIDNLGRYAYVNQPKIANWNLVRFAETLLPLIHQSSDDAIRMAVEILDEFPRFYKNASLIEMCEKLGFIAKNSNDYKLVEELLSLMEKNSLDYTQTFRNLCYNLELDYKSNFKVQKLDSGPSSLNNWKKSWHARLENENSSPEVIYKNMCMKNPAVIPRNHHVENVLAAALEEGDATPFYQFLETLRFPYKDLPDDSEYSKLPEPSNTEYQTFCGT